VAPTAVTQTPKTRTTAIKWVEIAGHVAALIPLGWLLYDFWTDNLTVNPIQDITFRTGTPALFLLVATLAITPLSTLGWREIVPLRRWFGLYAFVYASLHFLTFAVLDYGLDPARLVEAIGEKRFALVGFLAFCIMIPLAVTSTDGWQKRLGRRWKLVHRATYVAVGLAVVHYVWLVKADIRVPLIYGAVAAGLMVLRVPALRARLAGWGRRLRK
jgi:sulfoxide reductase heme-binding subunit YedZ